MNLWMLTTLPLEPLFRRDLWMQYKRRGGWNKLPAAGLTNHTGLVLDWGTGLIHWLASLTDLSEWLTLKIIGSAEDSSQVRFNCNGLDCCNLYCNDFAKDRHAWQSTRPRGSRGSRGFFPSKTAHSNFPWAVFEVHVINVGNNDKTCHLNKHFC